VAPDVVVGGASAVLTRFAEQLDLVAVATEGGDGDDVELGIDGARRPILPDGDPEPPVLVADGPRVVTIFRVLPDVVSRDAGPPVVTAATGPARRLVGVAGGRRVSPAEFAAAVAEHGFPAVVPDPLPIATGVAVVAWKEA
jgi:hypothetical protein